MGLPSDDQPDDQRTAIEKKLNEYKEQAMRSHAEMENLRRRTERDVANAHKYGTEKLITDLLPIVLEGDSKIILVISSSNDTSPYVSSDGQNRIAVSPGGMVEIYKKSKQLHLIHPKDYNYYETLRKKLAWGKRAVRI